MKTKIEEIKQEIKKAVIGQEEMVRIPFNFGLFTKWNNILSRGEFPRGSKDLPP